MASRNQNAYFSFQGVKASHPFLNKKSEIATIETTACEQL